MELASVGPPTLLLVLDIQLDTERKLRWLSRMRKRPMLWKTTFAATHAGMPTPEILKACAVSGVEVVLEDPSEQMREILETPAIVEWQPLPMPITINFQNIVDYYRLVTAVVRTLLSMGDFSETAIAGIRESLTEIGSRTFEIHGAKFSAEEVPSFQIILARSESELLMKIVDYDTKACQYGKVHQALVNLPYWRAGRGNLEMIL
ncbi:hypothetical protein [Cupriavidus lacunae]|uniref:Uncharacterized protein n=1 Tax=Cupriavidus lacunae TaxID=2666307 RepID=A0A370NML2_9BURK|nr:hypothetical protein [Cupriavidus lacunae]RDK06846.1 hypothetical protein DN412_29145 [Cupriavidus lacunae]